jgi:hypothetical protein
MGMSAAVPVLAFSSYGRDPTLAGLLLGLWGGGAMAGGIAAFVLVGRHEALRLGAVAWALQAAPLWALAAVLGGVVAWASAAATHLFAGEGNRGALLALLVGGVALVLAYVAGLRLLRVRELNDLAAPLRRFIAA